MVNSDRKSSGRDVEGVAFGRSELVAQVFEAGLRALHEDIQKRRIRKNGKALPESKKRYLPVELERAVYERDECKCQYQYEDGSRCESTWQLEIDHVKAFALGGKNEISNLRVTCRNHNQFLAREAGLGQVGKDVSRVAG